MNKLLDILLPRFITEEVALRDDGDHLTIVCSLSDVKPGERFDAVGTIRSFNLFGLAIFPRTVGEPLAWSDGGLGEELPTHADPDEVERLQADLSAARKQADELLQAINFLPGPWRDQQHREFILNDASGLRQAMANARKGKEEAESEALDLSLEIEELRREYAPQHMPELMREHRIAVTPEHEGQWHADLYGHEAEPIARAEGDSPEQAVRAVVAAYRSGSPAGQNLPQQEADQ